jgi:hypothetical protein
MSGWLEILYVGHQFTIFFIVCYIVNMNFPKIPLRDSQQIFLNWLYLKFQSLLEAFPTWLNFTFFVTMSLYLKLKRQRLIHHWCSVCYTVLSNRGSFSFFRFVWKFFCLLCWSRGEFGILSWHLQSNLQFGCHVNYSWQRLWRWEYLWSYLSYALTKIDLLTMHFAA